LHLSLKALIDLYLRFLSISLTSANFFKVDDDGVLTLLLIKAIVFNLTYTPVLMGAVLKM
tara:strand:+ start:669 stop:848 length:180 start_codon:yes stop_codon:yes gene_type:complete